MSPFTILGFGVSRRHAPSSSSGGNSQTETIFLAVVGERLAREAAVQALRSWCLPSVIDGTAGVRSSSACAA
jgi:hypothetical protein